jgi:hypothetical protein
VRRINEMYKNEKDFTTDVLKEIISINNLAGNFPQVHYQAIEGMLEMLDGAYARHEDPVKIHRLQVKQLYTLIKRAYRVGHRHGLENASSRIKATIFAQEV